MKPLKLTMTAFGPYKDKEVIDFTELDNHNLFVISGNTGAGKTTIFDGLSFALYGSASGQDRGETKMLRSDFADDDVHTSVELEFLLHQKHYRIKRQLGHVKEGNKTKTGEQYEFFVKKDGEEVPCVDRQIVSEINEKVEALIGITQDQFKQIVMLPQGEFRKLLTSDTENKEAILRRLFKTENYKEINDVLKNKQSKVGESYRQYKHERENYISSITAILPLREESLLKSVMDAAYQNPSQVIEGLEEEITFFENKITIDEQKYKEKYKQHDFKQESYHKAEQLNERFQELEEKLKTLNDLNEKKEEYKRKEDQKQSAEKASAVFMYEYQRDQVNAELMSKQKALREVTKKQEAMNESFQTALEIYKQEENKKPEREEVNKKIERLKDYLPVVKEIDKKKANLNALLQKGLQSKEEMQKKESRLNKLKQEEQSVNNEIKKHEQIIETLQEKPTEELKVNNKKIVYEKYIQLKKDVLRLKEERAKKEETFDKKNKLYEQKESDWFNNQAVVLAGHLHDGNPCPVCGSVDHPNKATVHEQEISRDQLEQLKKEKDEKEAAFQKVNIEVSTKLAQLQDVEEEVSTYLEDVNTIHRQYENLLHEEQQIKQDIGMLKESRKRVKNLKEQETVITKEKLELEPLLEQSKTLHQNLQQEYKTEQALYKERLSKIPEESQVLSELNKQLEIAEQEKEKLEKSWESAKISLEEKREAYTRAESNLENVKQQLKELQRKSSSAENAFKDAFTKQSFKNEEEYMQAKMDESAQKKLQDEINAYHQQVALIAEQTKHLKELLEGKEKQDLQVLQEEVSELKVAYEKALEELNTSRDYLKEAVKLKQHIKLADEKVKESEEQVSAIQDVYDTLRGQNNQKISFERFLQIEYLEQIISAANSRFQKLSNNQYYLTRSNRLESHGKQSGLALDVYDSHTGLNRDVKTLSGGEKFHAALSLALGMSDVIQSFQGQIAIDTMFIDEGFGSLDEEALNNAVHALIELMESGRMIGVISHVKELKEMFPAILEVKKTKEGHSETTFVIK